MEIENKQDKAYNLYINGLSLNKISKQSGLSKDNVKRLIKSEKWDKIKIKLYENARLYNLESTLCNFLSWIALYCRADFLDISDSATRFNKGIAYGQDDYLNLKLSELRNINKELEEIYSFVSLVYYSNKDCFERIFNEVIDFTTQIKKLQ